MNYTDLKSYYNNFKSYESGKNGLKFSGRYSYTFIVKAFLLMFLLFQQEKGFTQCDKPKQIPESEYYQIEDDFDLLSLYVVPDYFGGLFPQYEMASSYYNPKEPDCLFVGGGLSMKCSGIIIKKKRKIRHINSKEDFKKEFLPIDSEDEALSFISILTSSYPMYEFDIKPDFVMYVDSLEPSYAKKVDSGYVALTYDYDVFGCGPHYYYWVRSFIDFKGNVTVLEKTKIYYDPEDDWCVD